MEIMERETKRKKYGIIKKPRQCHLKIKLTKHKSK